MSPAEVEQVESALDAVEELGAELERVKVVNAELLEALKALLDGNEDLLSRYGHGLNTEQARAVIAKAEAANGH